MAFEAPDLVLYHGASVDVEQATKLALEAEKAALEYDDKIVNSNGASFNSHTGVRVYGNFVTCHVYYHKHAHRYAN